MRYLKIYEGFNNLEQDLKDILLEVNDIGFESYVDRWRHDKYIQITGNVERIYRSSTKDWVGSTHKEIRRQRKVNADKKCKEINDIVKDCLLRLKDYLGERYSSCEILYSDRYERLEITEKMNLKSQISQIEIYFK